MGLWIHRKKPDRIVISDILSGFALPAAILDALGHFWGSFRSIQR